MKEKNALLRSNFFDISADIHILNAFEIFPVITLQNLGKRRRKILVLPNRWKVFVFDVVFC